MRRYLFSLLILVLFPMTSYAACTDPEGAEGEQVFNTTHGVMQYCDNSQWVRMDGYGSSLWAQGSGYLFRESGSVGIGMNTVPADMMLAVDGKAAVNGIELGGHDNSDTNFITDLSRLPVITNAERGTVATTGLVVYNSEEDRIEFYDGTEWRYVTGVVSTGIGEGGT